MTIDWHEQWALHAPDFHEGFVHVKPFGFRLKPGPGFGDLSHSTTRLILEMLPRKISVPVVDIGCGSGVLSLAAHFAGAPEVYGIDIDEEAIQHAKENSKLNNVSLFFGKTLPKIPKTCLVLMNMISSEQRIAWETQKELHPHVEEMIVSGIPVDEQDRFLAASPYGTLISMKELEGWIACRYTQTTLKTGAA